jgi:hypothetical protein
VTPAEGLRHNLLAHLQERHRTAARERACRRVTAALTLQPGGVEDALGRFPADDHRHVFLPDSCERLRGPLLLCDAHIGLGLTHACFLHATVTFEINGL